MMKHPEETEKSFFLFLCPNTKCHYQTRHFSLFQTHLSVEHQNSSAASHRTVEIKVQELLKPATYMHITRFSHKNQRDIHEELQALERLEHDMKYSVVDRNLLNLIEKRSDFLQSLLIS